MVKSVRVPSYDRFHETVGAQSGEVFVMFFGTEEPATGRSWCPDCRNADAPIRAALDTYCPDAVLVEAPVGDRTEWRSSPYRNDPFNVSRVPTLVHWHSKKRLVESECMNEKKLKKFLNDEKCSVQ